MDMSVPNKKVEDCGFTYAFHKCCFKDVVGLKVCRNTCDKMFNYKKNNI